MKAIFHPSDRLGFKTRRFGFYPTFRIPLEGDGGILLASAEFGGLFLQACQAAPSKRFVRGFEAAADLLAAPFDECVVSARLDDLVEVF